MSIILSQSIRAAIFRRPIGPFELRRAEVAQRRVDPGSVVDNLDVLEQIQRGHLLVRCPDAREVTLVRGVRLVHARERHSYVCIGVFVGEAIYGRGNGWLNLVGNPAAIWRIVALPYDFAVAAPSVAALHFTHNLVSISAKGMAVVKPCPALSREVVEYAPCQEQRLLVKPG